MGHYCAKGSYKLQKKGNQQMRQGFADSQDDYPFFLVSEAVEQLLGTLAMLEWVVERLPKNWPHRDPGEHVRGLRGDDRSIAMHLAHLTLYEVKLANPILADLAAGGDGTTAVESAHVSWFLPEVRELSRSSIPEIMTHLRSARTRHIEIVRGFDDERFNVPSTALWGTGDGTRLESAGWVAVKTAQHTGEHINTLFRFMLFAPR